MIQPQELRIGNWAKTINDVPLKILTVGLHACQCQYDGTQNTEEEGKRISTIGFDSINPIPLTPEILDSEPFKQAGFKKIRSEIYDCDYFSIQVGKYGFGLCLTAGWYIVEIDHEVSLSQLTLPKVEYLHQFQNIVHSLTGQELQITL